jgi:hypothetical protein
MSPWGYSSSRIIVFLSPILESAGNKSVKVSSLMMFLSDKFKVVKLDVSVEWIIFGSSGFSIDSGISKRKSGTLNLNWLEITKFLPEK